MELPNIGQQCDFESCKQLDFLPLKCKCGLIFCSEHFTSHSLTCPAVVQVPNEPNFDAAKADYVCSHPNCTSRSYLPLLCPQCNQHFCVVHRHVAECVPKSLETKAAELEKFNTAAKEFESVKVEVNKELDNIITRARIKPKTQQMANKVQLMRIKGKATGPKSVAVSERVYFNVDHPVTNGRKTSPVFFSKIWTLGRVIDAVADECKLTNKNNQSDSLKLRLFHKATGEILSTNLAHKIESLLSDEILIEGEDLLIEYVDNNCTQLKSN